MSRPTGCRIGYPARTRVSKTSERSRRCPLKQCEAGRPPPFRSIERKCWMLTDELQICMDDIWDRLPAGCGFTKRAGTVCELRSGAASPYLRSATEDLLCRCHGPVYT